jgi:hypothetical protein
MTCSNRQAALSLCKEENMLDGSWPWKIGVMLLALHAIGGCSTCHEGDSHCDGTSLMVCTRGPDTEKGVGTLSWMTYSCTACVVTPRGPSCVDSPTPISECNGVSGAACWSGKPTTCANGYPVDTKDSCTAGTTCVVGKSNALCSLTLQPVPECANNTTGTCWKGMATTCVDGYPTQSNTCSAASTCVVKPSGSPICADSPQPVAECMGVVKGACWNGRSTTCDEGYPTKSMTCSASQSCVVDNCGNADCALSPSRNPRCGILAGDDVIEAVCDGDTALQCACDYLISSTPCAAGKCQAGSCVQ